MDLELAGDTAVVTASSSGLGKAAATALAKEGVSVTINGRDEQRLEQAAVEIHEHAPEAAVLPQQGDLTEPEEITSIIQNTAEEFGGIDHLVTSTGGPPSGQFLNIADEQWYDAFDLLVMSAVRSARNAIPYLQDGGGTITFITSTSVKEPIDSLVLSNAVRMSVIGLSKTLSKEFAPTIRVNSVLPGGHETARTEELIEQWIQRGDFDSYEDGLDHFMEGVPMERIGNPTELGEIVAYLSSPRASYINGTAIPVDGGKTASSL